MEHKLTATEIMLSQEITNKTEHIYKTLEIIEKEFEKLKVLLGYKNIEI